MKKRIEISVNLQGKNYRIDEHLNYIGYEKGFQISKAVAIDYSDEFMKYASLISAFIGVSKSDIYISKPTTEQLKSIYDVCLNICDAELPGIFPVISVNGKFFELIDFNKITVDQYTTIDSIIDNNDNRLVVAALISSIIYKPICKYQNIAQRLKSEAALSSIDGVNFGGYDKIKPTKKATHVLNPTLFSTGYLMSILNFIMNFKQSIQSEYKELFEENNEKKIEPKFMAKKSAVEVWGWYAVLNQLCENDQKKVNYWNGREMRELLTKLVYLKQLKNFK